MGAAEKIEIESVAWPTCGWTRCTDAAVVVRYISLEAGDLYAPARSWPMCDAHLSEWRVGYGDLRGRRIEPIVSIAPHSPEHLALEAAFYALACGGVYTRAELQRMNDEARGRG